MERLTLAQSPSVSIVSGGTERKRPDSHIDQIGAMDSLEGACDHRFNANQITSLRRRIARRSIAVFLACEDDKVSARFGVMLDRITDRDDLAKGQQPSITTSATLCQPVFQHICKKEA